MISKELLSEVLDCEVVKIMPNSVEIVEYSYLYRGSCPSYTTINIHELSYKVMNWIESQGFWVRIVHRDTYELIHNSVEVYSIDTKTRLHVSFMCGQWILDNK